jgi:hypothetical protein
MPYKSIWVMPEVLTNFKYKKIWYTIFRAYKDLEGRDPLENWVNVTLKHANIQLHEIKRSEVDMREASPCFVPTTEWYETVQQKIDEGKIDMEILLAHVGDQ